MSRRALISTADLRRMAKVAREEGVAFKGRVDPLGNLSFSMAPLTARNDDGGDDLDDRLTQFGSQ